MTDTIEIGDYVTPIAQITSKIREVFAHEVRHRQPPVTTHELILMSTVMRVVDKLFNADAEEHGLWIYFVEDFPDVGFTADALCKIKRH